jgi:hypothetical protein
MAAYHIISGGARVTRLRKAEVRLNPIVQ